MEVKKNPKAILENYSKIFMQIGLVLTLFIVYNMLEFKTIEKQVETFSNTTISKEIEEDIPIIQHNVQPPPPPPKQVVLPEKLVVVENHQEIEETVIETTETDETEAVAEYVEPEEIDEVEEVEEVVEDVPFMIIEDVPVFPGCTGSKQELKQCFSKKLQQFFIKKFNGDLAQDLGLHSGKKKMYVSFKINKYGEVTDIKSRAPHPLLKKEASKIIGSLPKIKPGRQRGKPVGVKYTLPITFLVQ